MPSYLTPDVPLPRLTQAMAPLTCEIATLNEYGEQVAVSIPAERALTVYVDKRELVTLMTLGAHPELLVLGYLRKGWWRGACGGSVAHIGYGIAIWALAQGPMAHVAALRETSVLFGALMGTLLLGEAFGVRRVIAAAVIVAGLVLMNAPRLF